MKQPKLKTYRGKRRFDRTPEPTGGVPVGEDPIFVIQKHAARRLHYDLRLQVGDTLLSWAVPEGPSLDPKVRRFAKHVEDHPLDYAAFEGRIPQGEYGAGTVIVWDRGAWTSLKDPTEAIEAGELKFRLIGEKLRGGWTLVRLPDDPTNWLLIKERDAAARAMAEYDVLIEAPDSVVTGASVDAISPLPTAKMLKPPIARNIKGAVRAPMPAAWPPQLASQVAAPPIKDVWLHEIKYDGYRTICFFDDGEVRLITRNGHDWTSRYASLAKILAGLACTSAILDGEVVVQDARGVSQLSLLEQALADGQSHALTYFAFDLGYLDGFDLTAATLVERKAALERLIDPLINPRSPVQYSQHVEGDGTAFFARACELGLEGIISKKVDSRYLHGRSPHWLKIKRSETGTFPIIGFSANTPQGVSSLVLGELRDGELNYIGKAGSGISDAKGRRLYAQLAPLEQSNSAAIIPAGDRSRWGRLPPLRDIRWVSPEFSALIAHRGRTDTGALRHGVVLSAAPNPPAAPARPAKPRLITDRDLAGIEVTNPKREMFSGSGVSKLDIAVHYARVGDWMLPHILRRPLTFVRCTTGDQKDCFYQRHAFSGLPDGIAQIELSDEEGRAAFISIVEPKGYLALAQFGAIEFHVWGSTIDNPEHADRMVIDLDPAADVPWGQVCDAAEILKDRLSALGFAPYLRTTGGKGLHLVMALAKDQPWPMVKGFSQAFAKAMARDAPSLFTAVAAKAKRPGKIYIDYLRNARGATAVASYSLRARDGFPVATPIAWSELRSLSGGDAFTISNIQIRLNNDPWDELVSDPTKITPRMAREVGMVS